MTAPYGVPAHTPTAATAPTGNIYDLGYRHYQGKRNGRLYAMWSLFVESFRGVWGFGRPMQAKAAPFILGGLYALPAVVQLAFSSVFAQRISAGDALQLLTYHDYFASFYFLVFFFCVAQAPELVCRDQRYQVLPLYFTRAMGRVEYALARLGSLAVALLILLLVPTLALFVGEVLMKPDTFKAIGDELPKALPSIPASALIAVGLATLSLAISSFSPRRAYSAIGIVAYILLMEAIPAALYSIGQTGGSTWTDKLFVVSPITSLIGAGNWFFGQPLSPQDFAGSLTSGSYLAASVAGVLVMTVVLLFRYRRLPA
jgi:ABC-2 type transport system permease protein